MFTLHFALPQNGCGWFGQQNGAHVRNTHVKPAAHSVLSGPEQLAPTPLMPVSYTHFVPAPSGTHMVPGAVQFWEIRPQLVSSSVVWSGQKSGMPLELLPEFVPPVPPEPPTSPPPPLDEDEDEPPEPSSPPKREQPPTNDAHRTNPRKDAAKADFANRSSDMNRR
jgi:hypothetical protein